jgi:hypothetical protein
LSNGDEKSISDIGISGEKLVTDTGSIVGSIEIAKSLNARVDNIQRKE